MDFMIDPPDWFLGRLIPAARYPITIPRIGLD
jgi:hypothetical protein